MLSDAVAVMGGLVALAAVIGGTVILCYHNDHRHAQKLLKMQQDFKLTERELEWQRQDELTRVTKG